MTLPIKTIMSPLKVSTYIIEDLSFDKFVGIYAYLSLRSHWFLAVICFPGIKENRRVRYICKPKEEKPTNGEANTDKVSLKI
jgi:hypothetical protein